MQLNEEKEKRQRKGFLSFLLIFGAATFGLVLIVTVAGMIVKKVNVPQIGVAESAAVEAEVKISAEPEESIAPAELTKEQKELGKLLPIPGYNYLYYSKGPGIVYIRMDEAGVNRGYGFLAPFYSKNGNLYRYENGFFKELQGNVGGAK